jgi:hypothetical protein
MFLLSDGPWFDLYHWFVILVLTQKNLGHCSKTIWLLFEFLKITSQNIFGYCKIVTILSYFGC